MEPIGNFSDRLQEREAERLPREGRLSTTGMLLPAVIAIALTIIAAVAIIILTK